MCQVLLLPLHEEMEIPAGRPLIALQSTTWFMKQMTTINTVTVSTSVYFCTEHHWQQDDRYSSCVNFKWSFEMVTTRRRCWSKQGCCQRPVKWSTSAQDWDRSCQDGLTNIQTRRRRRPTDCMVSGHSHRSLVLMLVTAHHRLVLTVSVDAGHSTSQTSSHSECCCWSQHITD